MYDQELKISKQAAKQAGKFLKKEFFNWDNKKLKLKANHERVTWCDKQSEQIILKELNKHFPNYGVLSEESGLTDKPSDYFWIIDPLDGTTNFTIHQPIFSITIALLYKKKVVLGIIYAPILDEMYYAVQDQGAFKNKKKIMVSEVNTLENSIVTYCHGQGQINTNKAYKLYEHFHNKIYHCQHFGSTALELAMVAAGNTQAHMISGAKLWDIAASTILIREAGGLVTDWNNKEWNINSTSILAANKKIHAICREELKQLKLA